MESGIVFLLLFLLIGLMTNHNSRKAIMPIIIKEHPDRGYRVVRDYHSVRVEVLNETKWREHLKSTQERIMRDLKRFP